MSRVLQLTWMPPCSFLAHNEAILHGMTRKLPRKRGEARSRSSPHRRHWQKMCSRGGYQDRLGALVYDTVFRRLLVAVKTRWII